MSNLVINDLPNNKALDKQALANFNGGTNPYSLLAQIKAETADAGSALKLNQEPELGIGGFATGAKPPFTLLS